MGQRQGQGKGRLSDPSPSAPKPPPTPAREALERGDHAEAARLGDDPEVTAYLRPDRAAVVLAVLCFLLFVPISVYYVLVR